MSNITFTTLEIELQFCRFLFMCIWYNVQYIISSRRNCGDGKLCSKIIFSFIMNFYTVFVVYNIKFIVHLYLLIHSNIILIIIITKAIIIMWYSLDIAKVSYIICFRGVVLRLRTVERVYVGLISWTLRNKIYKAKVNS